jgi:hypothetical protein
MLVMPLSGEEGYIHLLLTPFFSGGARTSPTGLAGGPGRYPEEQQGGEMK